jgi:hypothetical protein
MKMNTSLEMSLKTSHMDGALIKRQLFWQVHRFPRPSRGILILATEPSTIFNLLLENVTRSDRLLLCWPALLSGLGRSHQQCWAGGVAHAQGRRQPCIQGGLGGHLSSQVSRSTSSWIPRRSSGPAPTSFASAMSESHLPLPSSGSV